MPRKIGILTHSQQKFSEFALQLERYGIQCEWITVYKREEIPLHQLIREGGLMGLLQEQTELWSLTKNKRVRGTPDDFDAVRHISHLHYYRLNPDDTTSDELQEFTYENATDGTINLGLGIEPLPEDCYHWDMVFVVDRCGLSLYQIKQQAGRKVSSRDLNIAAFFKEHIHYRKQRDLFHSPQQMASVVDFDGARASRTLCGLVDKGSDFIRFPLAVLNRGVFLRSARSRRSFLYWCPGLNAGLPLVPKPKDPMHERTFMFHDLIHFLMPDLVFDGDTSQHAKVCYVAYRLSSELISLVVADMLFVAQSTTPYPTVAERRIFPLYQAFGKHPEIDAIFEGAFQYGFYRDDTHWREMIKRAQGDVAALDSFREKYDNYILQDFRWTFKNWACMSQYQDAFRRWWKDYGHLTTHIESVSSFVKQHQLKDIEDRDVLLKRIFDIAKEQVMSILRQPTPALDIKQGLHNAIGNYMVGQARIFYQFDFLPQTRYYHEHLHAALSKGIAQPDQRPSIDKLRAIYNKYLAILAECRLIDPDDQELYKELYPIFDAAIVDYRERPDLDPLVELAISQS